MERTVIKLEELDSAIIFRNNDDIELLLDDEDGPINHKNINLTLAVMYALKNDELRELIEQYFEKKCLQIKFQSKTKKNHHLSSRSSTLKEEPRYNASNVISISEFQKERYAS